MNSKSQTTSLRMPIIAFTISLLISTVIIREIEVNLITNSLLGLLFSLLITYITYLRIRFEQHEIALAAKIADIQTVNDQLHSSLSSSQRLINIYAALSHCNEAIVTSNNEHELFTIICQDIVEHGNMQMAWVGMFDQTTQLIKPVAWFGNGTEYIEGIQISTNAEDSIGQGPTGTAMRENKPYWCQDFQHAPETRVWHERGTHFGWAASASLPLHRDQQVVGALTFYAALPHAFDEQAKDLLLKMASNISYALKRFALEREKEQISSQLIKLSMAVEQSPASIVITDLNAQIEYVNQTFINITDYNKAEIIGQNPRMLQSGQTTKTTYNDMWTRLKRGESWQGELINKRKDGSIYIESSLVSPIRQADGKITHYLAIKENITDKKQAEARIQQLAHFDQLTNLPNRTLLLDRFSYAQSLAQSNHQSIAIFSLDLDQFKNVNETLGHRMGDLLLIEVAQRLKTLLRDEDTVSRMGGDEFILLLPNMNSDTAAIVAAQLIDQIGQPYIIFEQELNITTSIGIAVYPENGSDFETLFKCADTAMYLVKQDTRNDFRFFTPAMQQHSQRNMLLLNELRHAIARNELRLYYQPQISLPDEQLIGMEALIRWQHPTLGMISPAEFIPLAESSGLIISIGEWVLNTAIKQMKDWLTAGCDQLVVAVNLSAIQFHQPNLTAVVCDALTRHQLPAQYLELELTESVAMKEPQTAIDIINALYNLGIRISIDDFGTGYSSLSYLKKFNIHKLKIDQSFIRDLHNNQEDKIIVSTIINLANSLGLQTIAEGVETITQLDFLRQQGCDEIQGYYFSKPLPSHEMEHFMRSRQQ